MGEAGRWARRARLLAVVVVVLGTAGALLQIGRGVDDRRVEFSGSLDAVELVRRFQPRPGETDPRPRLEARGLGYLDRASGTYVRPQATATQLAVWAVAVLFPWAVAAAALRAALPVLRAVEVGDAFTADGARRLARAGAVLLVGMPLTAVVRFAAALPADVGGSVPAVTPNLTLRFDLLLPGLLVLALAGVFAHGAELRELERHTV